MNSLSSELVLQVRERAERETAALSSCVGEEDVADAERVLGFSLPPLLSLLYCQAANGGFGPEYTLLPLIGDGRTAVAEYGPLRSWIGVAVCTPPSTASIPTRPCSSSSRTPALTTGPTRGSWTRRRCPSG